MSLGEICKIRDNERKPISKQNRIKGIYPYYGANGIIDYIDDYIFDGTFILLGEDGSVINEDKTPVLNWATSKIWVNNHAHILEQLDNYNLRFIYYCLQVTDISNMVRGLPPKLNQKNLKTILIPIPPLKTQEKIVNILDKFNTLTSDLTKGLPQEIDLRKKQYEYYREKLLTFKEIEALK
ncbi:restriction endonuclease subunit S [Campylobacter sp. FMV-PI01]|uniref:Restriction endonuclease subunit S n=2 Tax=Campylobacter portucalensis TaxID=2608384 RepID=A0A6L5WJ65_9BACT|nr:restriction endonuclease subunit S [Campylobacter portucalensis]